MKYYDISTPIHTGMPVYEGDPPVEVAPLSSLGKGDKVNVSRLNMTTHTGTHMDAPLHFIGSGKNICQISFEKFLGPALVVDMGAINAITPDVLVRHPLRGEKKVLFKTRNSTLWDNPEFQKDFTYLTGSAANYLVELGVELVGIDYLSIEKFGPDYRDAHLTLLQAAVVVLEGLNLSQVEAGKYQLISLPLPVRNGDGAPCRAILLEQ